MSSEDLETIPGAPAHFFRMKYKCRSCEKDFDGPSGERSSIERALLSITVHGHVEVPGAGVLTDREIHICKNGDIGVGQLIGAVQTVIPAKP